MRPHPHSNSMPGIAAMALAPNMQGGPARREIPFMSNPRQTPSKLNDAISCMFPINPRGVQDERRRRSLGRQPLPRTGLLRPPPRPSGHPPPIRALDAFIEPCKSTSAAYLFLRASAAEAVASTRKGMLASDMADIRSPLVTWSEISPASTGPTAQKAAIKKL